MLLALRRLFGLSDAASAREDTIDRSREKWVIEPSRVGLLARGEELWRYRRILWFLSVRRVTERYKKTTLGSFWLFARPLGPIIISSIVFGGFLGVPSDGVPYFLFFLTGMSCWRIFDRSMLWVTRSLEVNRSLLKKVYFPRLVAPIASVSPAFAEYLILLGLFLGTVAVYRVKDGVFYLQLGWPLLVAAAGIVLTVFFSVACGLWTSVWQTRHKDVRYSIRYFTQFWLFATPVLYPMSVVPEQYQWLLYVNPMAPFVQMYKWGMLGIGELPVAAIASGTGVAVALFAAGVVYFNSSEAASVDSL